MNVWLSVIDMVIGSLRLTTRHRGDDTNLVVMVKGMTEGNKLAIYRNNKTLFLWKLEQSHKISNSRSFLDLNGGDGSVTLVKFLQISTSDDLDLHMHTAFDFKPVFCTTILGECSHTLGFSSMYLTISKSVSLHPICPDTETVITGSSFLPHNAQMGMIRRIKVFQSISKSTIQTGMGKKYETHKLKDLNTKSCAENINSN